eukprot:SAG22_NODE_17987_length_295_cov_0.841837_2_plen_52_part_01
MIEPALIPVTVLPARVALVPRREAAASTIVRWLVVGPVPAAQKLATNPSNGP